MTTLPSRDREELDELLGALRDETLTADQAARLDVMIGSDPRAQLYYLDYVQLCSNLRHYLGTLGASEELAQPGSDDSSRETVLNAASFFPDRFGAAAIGPGRDSKVSASPSIDRPADRRPSGRSLRVALVGTVAASALITALTYSRFRPRPSPRPADPGPAAIVVPPRPVEVLIPSRVVRPAPRPKRDRWPIVAVLTHVVGARWEGGHLPIREGATLEQGHLRLESGQVQIEFFSGASVILEGPADLELISPEKAICHRGKVRAHVPSHAHGFTIGGPGLDAIDLGTEFAMKVDDRGRGEVHVLDGEVEIRGVGAHPATPEARTLKAGHGLRFGQRGGPSEIAAAPGDFVDPAQLQAMLDAQSHQRQGRWLIQSQALRADTACLLYYSFDDHSPWERTVRNVGVGLGSSLDGSIVGCLWTEGRWPGKGAIEFKRPSDRVRVDVPGHSPSLTFTAWVRVEGLNQRFSALLLTDDWDPGEPHWQITSAGSLLLGVKNPPEINQGQGSDYLSPHVLGSGDLGRWVHLTTTYDGPRKLVTHYLDGRPISHHRIDTPIPLHLGAAEIGNWNKVVFRDTNPVRRLDGRLDEFGVFGRAFTDDEVRAMYDVGKPNP